MPVHVYNGLTLDCTECDYQGQPQRKQGDAKSVCRCPECGKRHNTDSLEVAE